MRFTSIAAAAALALSAASASGQRPPDAAAMIAQQRTAMAKLAVLDGVWRGTAWTILPDGSRHEINQTERIGTFLDGSVRVFEGRGYEAGGKMVFNAFGIVSFDPAANAYRFRSYAMGHQGDFPFRALADGYEWEVPAGPGAIIRYVATIKNGTFREVGHRIAGSAAPVQVFEMNLKRVGSTKWPAEGAVPMR
ncbi:MAG TPA: DUF1579 domain-containing protein [Allosphingosinicella sp.]|jgi:hypothetical protein